LIRTSVWALTDEVLHTPEFIQLIKWLYESIVSKVGTQIEDDLPVIPKDLFATDEDQNIEPSDNAKTSIKIDATPEAIGKYLTAELFLPQGEEFVQAIEIVNDCVMVTESLLVD
jgi:hypothetical protein